MNIESDKLVIALGVLEVITGRLIGQGQYSGALNDAVTEVRVEVYRMLCESAKDEVTNELY